MQVMTVVEGKIHKTRAQDFLSMYASVRDQVKPPGWKRSMLLQDTGDKDLFRISTLWESREALEQMRKNSKAPQQMSSIPRPLIPWMRQSLSTIQSTF